MSPRSALTVAPSSVASNSEETQSIPLPTRSEKPHLEFIDGIRALAALFVMVCHAYFEPANGYYAGRFMNHLGLTYGHVAVDVFIVVSGFCLMLPVTRRGGHLGSPTQFFARRARRILPPYYASLALSALFILAVAHVPTGTVWDNCLPLTWAQFLAHVFLIHDLPLNLKGGSINYPLWSIAVECQVYLFMPLVVLSLRRMGAAGTLAWTIAFGVILHLASAGRLDTATPWYLGLFALGAVAAHQGVQTPRRWWRPVSYILWVLVAAVIVGKGKQFFDSHFCFIDTLVGLATALLMGATLGDAAGRGNGLTRALSWRPLVRVGLFSYSLYLVHAPLLHAVNLLLRHTLHPSAPVTFLLLLGASPLIVGVAYLFHLLFEKPFMTTAREKPRFGLRPAPVPNSENPPSV